LRPPKDDRSHLSESKSNAQFDLGNRFVLGKLHL